MLAGSNCLQSTHAVSSYCPRYEKRARHFTFIRNLVRAYIPLAEWLTGPRLCAMCNCPTLLIVLWLTLVSSSAFGADFETYRKALIAGDSASVVVMLRTDAGRAPVGPREQSLLHMASSSPIGDDRAKMTAALLAAGANIEARDNGGATPLNWAAGSDCGECVKLLLKAGAQVTARNTKGSTALHVSGPQIAALLIAAGADPEAADIDGNLPLHKMHHDAFLVAGVNVRNKYGFTPLHFAALGGNEGAVRWLLSKGADPSAQSTARYEYHELSPDWKANPEVIETGTRPYDIALRRHASTKMSTGRYRVTLEILDQVTPRRQWHSR